MNIRRPDPDKLRALRIILKAAYDCVAAEPVPQNIDAVLKGLK